MASVAKGLARIVEESLSDAFHDAWRREILQRAGWIGWRIEMPRRGRYQVWNGQQLVADRIKHRKEALAVMKLLKENKDGTS